MNVDYAPWPVFSIEERTAVDRVLASGRVNYWTGTEGRDFEEEFAATVGLSSALFVANGTVALELALRALRLPQGSEVITTSRTFIATSNVLVNLGLRPVFADVDARSGNISPISVKPLINERTSAILVVHLGGWPAEMHTLRSLADQYELALVEDCSQAHGATIGAKHVGTFGDIAAWSFCQDKIISTMGEGGMVATNSRKLTRRMWSYRDHGKSWDAVFKADHAPGFRWLHESFGSNYRGTEAQAAVGRIQYRKLPDWHLERRANAYALAAMLAGTEGLRVPVPDPGIEHAFYRLYAYLDVTTLAEGWTRDAVLQRMTERFGVPGLSGSCSEVYRERAYVDAGIGPAARLPNAKKLGDESIAFLVHPGTTTADLQRVANATKTVIAEAQQQSVSATPGMSGHD